MTSSEAGDAWKSFLQRDDLSWHSPAKVDAKAIQRHAESPWIQILLKYAPLKPTSGVRILEAGCGTAMFGTSLALLGFAVDAFDFNPEALVFARDVETKARIAKPNLQLNFALGNILSMDFESGTYDLVFNQAVLEYFSEQDRRRALTEMSRVAKPHGFVAAIVQHTGHPWRGAWERMGWRGYTDQPPIVKMTPSQLATDLEDAGLQNVCVDGINPWKAFFFYPPWYNRWRLTHEMIYLTGRALSHLPLPLRLRRALAIQIIGVGQKI